MPPTATLTCASCGRTNPADAAFCAGCGTALENAQVAPPPEPVAAPEQRRYLTVMFTDLADSTRLAGELDPEDMRDLYRAYQAACTEAIARNAGYAAQFMGDGVLAYFGYPEAHEDDARLAVSAGLEIVAAADRLRARLERADISVRVGIHSGEVVVASMGGRQHSIV